MIIRKLKIKLLKLKYGKRIDMKCSNLMRNSSIKISKNGSVYIGNALLNENVFICASDKGSIRIEDGVTINRNSILVAKESIVVGAGSSIGPNVCIYDHDHIVTEDGFSKKDFVTGKIVIGHNVWVAANVTILKGSHIGDNCIIGAGTIIKGNISDNSIVYNERKLHIENIRQS